MKSIIASLVFFALLLLPNSSFAHSGRTDSSGGHNCYVGSCAGEYHYHNGSSAYPPYTPPIRQPVVTYEYYTEKETVYFKTTEQNNDQLFVGEKETLVKGSAGEISKIYKVTYTDGVQTSKELSSSSVTKPVVNAVISVGTKQKPVQVAGLSDTKLNSESRETSKQGNSFFWFMGVTSLLSAISYGIFKVVKNRN